MNFAIFTENQASNFAVPIRYGVTLLERAGWTAPVEKDGKDTEAASQQNPQAALVPQK